MLLQNISKTKTYQDQNSRVNPNKYEFKNYAHKSQQKVNVTFQKFNDN